MKDFVKWLGVNEKIAKVVVWLLIIMVTLIIFNTGLESIGFPHYAITYDNLKKVNVTKGIEYMASSLIVILNFYSVVLLVFRVKESKKIFKYACLYLIINFMLSIYLGKGLMQLFIILYLIIFSYLYSNKQKKYILYIMLAYCITIGVQGVWYLSKARFIDYSNLNYTTRSLLSLDYFIIMSIIILVKEVYLKKRGENDGRRWISNLHPMDRRIQKRKQIRKETSKKSSKSSKISK